MVVPFILSFIGFIGIATFIILKVPEIVELSEEKIRPNNKERERLEEKVKKEVKEIFEDFLQLILQNIRKIIVKIEGATTKWLYALKRKKRQKKDKKEEQF